MIFLFFVSTNEYSIEYTSSCNIHPIENIFGEKEGNN